MSTHHGEHWWRSAETNTADPATMAAELLDALGTGTDLVQLQVFAAREADRAALDAAVKQACGERRPAVHTVVQRPCSGSSAAALAWGVGPVLRERITRPEPGVVLLTDGEVELGFHDAVYTDDPGDDESEWWHRCFAGMEERLHRVGLRVEDLAKTWTLFGEGQASPRKHFEAFNRARAEFFAGRSFPLVAEDRAVPLPANTGISMGQPGAALAYLTCRCAGPAARAMANPDQLAPSDYPAEEIATAPLFSRAVALDTASGPGELVLVAGTASVVGWKTAHPFDPLRQAGQTGELIARLLDPDGERPDEDPILCKIVYLARDATGEQIRAAAAGSTGAPCVLVEAELSRDELRVEMDAVARRPGPRN